jgi:NDP-sugar pyrophosphorylase family protein/aminoglycoside/choline kinase family phosphotransferase
VKRPRKAIVLAAGFGSRLSPVTLDCPKPLIPVKGKALIQRVLEQLAAWGVNEVLVNIHHGADIMVNELPRCVPGGMRMTISFEPEILGTGGGLRRMAWFFDREEPLWICNADVVQELDPQPLLTAYEREKPLACLWMLPDQGPRTVSVEEGRITDFRGGGMTFSGLHLVAGDLLDFLPEAEVFSSVITAYEAGIAKGKRVLGIPVLGSFWEDAGTLERLLSVNGGSVICPGAEVERGAVVSNALVGPGARIRSGRTVSGMVVSPESGLTPEERKHMPDAEAVEGLPPRGSDRSFVRVHGPRESRILIRSGQARPENARTAGHFRFLARQGVNVPKVFYASKDGQMLWMEDAGRVHLLDRLKTGSSRRNRSDMKKVLAEVARFHALRVPPKMELEPEFSKALYRWEHELFLNEFLARHDPHGDGSVLKQALEETASALDNMPKALIHRDLQSTNFLWNDGQPVMIDVQGMRRGPRVYDLASLLADPYVGRSKAEQLELLEWYHSLSGVMISQADYARGAVQRLVQALGAYGRLGAQPATRRFQVFIPEAVRQLRFWTPESALKDWAEDFHRRHSDEISC